MNTRKQGKLQQKKINQQDVSNYNHISASHSAPLRPPSVLDDAFEIKTCNDEIVLKRASSDRQGKKDSMLASITPENLHGRIDFGAPIGKELL